MRVRTQGGGREIRLRTAGAAAILAVLLVTAAVGPALAQENEERVVGSPDLSFTTSAGAVEPGSATDIPISVVNRGDVVESGPARHEERVKTARGVVVTVDSGDSPIRVNTGQLTAGNVQEGSQTIGQLSLSVPGDVEPGTYHLDVEYEYQYTREVQYGTGSPQYDDLTRSRETTLEVRVDEQAQFTVEDVESSVLAAQTGEVQVTMRNTGGEPAADASVTAASLSQELGFGSGNPTANAYVGDWEPGATKTVAFDAAATPQASTGNYTAELTVTYDDSSDVDQAAGPISVGIPVGGEQNFALNDVESTLQVGYEGRIQATLVNEGPKPIRNPVAVLNVTDPRMVVTSPDQALPDLAPGERTTLNFSVDVSDQANPTRKQVAIILNWEAPTGDRLTTRPLRPAVRIHPRQDRFAVEAVNGSVPSGGSEQVEIRVTNQGNEVLSNVEAQAFYPEQLSGEDNQGYIPELASGETKSFLVDVSADSGATREPRPLTVDFRYELPSGTSQVSDQYRVPIEVTNQEGGGGLLPLLGGAVIAALIGGGLVYRRRSDLSGPAITPG